MNTRHNEKYNLAMEYQRRFIKGFWHRYLAIIFMFLPILVFSAIGKDVPDAKSIMDILMLITAIAGVGYSIYATFFLFYNNWWKLCKMLDKPATLWIVGNFLAAYVLFFDWPALYAANAFQKDIDKLKDK